MKASDYIASVLRERVGYVFGIQGGAVVHLFDSFSNLGPKPIYCHHEQAAGFSAVAYSKVYGFGVCVVTTGPAATNCITPCLGAWQDSIPVLFISGQTRKANMSYGTGRRQIGSQEAPICDLIEPITKFQAVVTDPSDLAEVLNDAMRMSLEKRQGPSWIDIPVDIQWAEV